MSDRAAQSGFARIAEALADPAREAIVAALADGKARPAGELAVAAGVSPQNASAHLLKLVGAGVLQVRSQGRFRYYEIANDDVAAVIEGLVNLATQSVSAQRLPRKSKELMFSRSCYQHLAGELGVALSKALVTHKYVSISDRTGTITEEGEKWCRTENIALPSRRRSPIRLCVDWTERVPHLAGPFPTAIFHHLIEKKMLAFTRIPRALRVTTKGREFFDRLGVRIRP